MCNSIKLNNIQCVQEKLCFFKIHCNPSLAYIAVRGLQSSQRNTSAGEGKVANTIFNKHPVHVWCVVSDRPSVVLVVCLPCKSLIRGGARGMKGVENGGGGGCIRWVNSGTQ